jgi:small neutral amino acid transporter SnatA (MarC family)
MPLDFAISALVTLFVVVDPIGLAPTFLAVTEGLPASSPARSSSARRFSATGCSARLAFRCPRFALPAVCSCSPSPSRWF